MKIERISENKVRFSLTEKDLDDRQITVAELGYGSAKARSLFHDMMILAHRQFGFTNETGTPLLIEAIPGSGNSLTIVITKVDDPEELDTRFAKFSFSREVADGSAPPQVEGADDIIDMFQKLLENKGIKMRRKSADSGSDEAKAPEGSSASAADSPVREPANNNETETSWQEISISRGFSFISMRDTVDGAAAVAPLFHGNSSLYFIKEGSSFLLIISQPGSPEEFNRICNILTEYGVGETGSPLSEVYLCEHAEQIFEAEAVEKLASFKESKEGLSL
ncbi:MAG: adaptor protein MecA [Lachnospiraceae bacterium]|nr:adaptor protein MecA [Lachnospiraceae bacterium]